MAVAGQRTINFKAKMFASLLSSVPGARIIGNGKIRIAGLSYDSRQVAPGFAFFCVRRGVSRDGHQFISDAIKRGAVALVVEPGREEGVAVPEGGAIGIVPDTRQAMPIVARSFYDDPSSRLTLAGVTGTNGKTTTSQMIEAIFQAAGSTSGLIGTVEYRIGKRRLPAPHTTPEALDLQRLLYEMTAEGVTHAAMEVSSHALALNRVDGCQFAAAVFTNLTPEHLDFHPDMNHYLDTKLGLFTDEQYFPRGKERINAINLDDDAGVEIAKRAVGKTLGFSLIKNADCRGEKVELSADGTRFVALLPTGRLPIRMRLIGKFNVYNALGALAACIGLDIPPEAVQRGLENMPPVRGRFERVPSRTRNVLVDYAHSPDGLERALETARQLGSGRLILVFGCGGNRDRTKRPVMGELAARLSDRCVVTSDNPRNEQPEAIIEEILAGIPEETKERCLVEVDREKAIRLAIQEAQSEDVVLIAGKGHEDYQIFAGGCTIHFDDREVAQAVIREIEGEESA